MTTATTKKARCVATYKNGNPCRAYAVHGYLCGQHQHLRTSAEVRAKITEIERQNAERERQFNEILAQEAHTRLLTAEVLAIPSSGGMYRSRQVFVSAEDVNKIGWDSIFPDRFDSADRRFTPYRDQRRELPTGWMHINGLESQRARQSELGRLTGSISTWGLNARQFVKSNLLCREMKPYDEDFPGAKRAKISAIVNCPNPRVGPSPAHRSESQCIPCRRETQAMHNLLRRINEEDGACEHGLGCWPSLNTVIDQGGGRCYYCGVSVTRGLGKNTDACRDHYIPVSRGGSHCKDNAVLACRHCNGSKHDNMPPPTRETAAPALARDTIRAIAS